ncbi:MAG: hypothetical protein Q8M54_10125 [Desulfobaccales bacterium]|nr:hypothetical protein [Desulfobaccales bacterium]
MDKLEKRYGGKGTLKPCCLGKDDLLKLNEIIQETFTPTEIDKYFNISTTIGGIRVFSGSIEAFLQQKGLPDEHNDLAFWIESWDKMGSFDKNILLDFSKYSIQLSVEGVDQAWVHDKYAKIVNFLKAKTVWYWPLITLERFIIFVVTLILISNIITSFKIKGGAYYIDEIVLLGVWIFLVFYDTRKIWPHANIRLQKVTSIFNKANIIAVILIMILVATLMVGTILPLLK